jgi:hypothetical protein
MNECRLCANLYWEWVLLIWFFFATYPMKCSLHLTHFSLNWEYVLIKLAKFIIRDNKNYSDRNSKKKNCIIPKLLVVRIIIYTFCSFFLLSVIVTLHCRHCMPSIGLAWWRWRFSAPTFIRSTKVYITTKPYEALNRHFCETDPMLHFT